VVKRLKANTEQCQRNTDADGHNAWQSDNYHDWLIKPRIRIDSNVAHNSGNTNVCRIVVLNQNRDTIKSAIIKAVHFINPQTGLYNGQYLEEYYFGQNDSNLTVHGDWAAGTNPWCWLWDARGTRTLQQEETESFNHADIQVYWYGNCNMWIDYVRVDNDIADELFNPNNPGLAQKNWTVNNV
jgi:hypothetical protein